MAETFSEPEPPNHYPDPYIPPNEISGCDDPSDPCDSCPAPRIAVTWSAGGDYGFDPDEDLQDGEHSIWVGGVNQWYWQTGGSFLREG